MSAPSSIHIPYPALSEHIRRVDVMRATCSEYSSLEESGKCKSTSTLYQLTDIVQPPPNLGYN